MKIGILTFHRSHNYGALLQAIALRQVLVNMGHDVSYVDYYPLYDKRLYMLRNIYTFREKPNLRKKLGFLYHTLFDPDLLCRWLRIRNFKRFRKIYTEPFFLPVSTEYDVIIYGSDQLWRKQPFIKEYDPVYFGDNNFNTLQHISYAVSLDHLPETEEDKQQFNQLVKNINRLSVREWQTKTYLEKNGFSDVSVNVDPTLLLTAAEWGRVIPAKRLVDEKYILVFDLQKNKSVRLFQPDYLDHLSKRYKCKIVYLRDEAYKLPTRYDWQTAAPDEFLNLIRYAECILTSSFHATVFAILYHKLFYNAQTWGSIRSKSLLSQLGLENRMLAPNQKIDDLFKSVDYSGLDEKLNIMKESSLEYLKKCNCGYEPVV